MKNANKKPARSGFHKDDWRRGSESNRRRRLCRPLHDHSATPPGAAAGAHRTGPMKRKGRARKTTADALPHRSGAGNESRTRDLNLGKVALYQLSYSRVGQPFIIAKGHPLSKSRAGRSRVYAITFAIASAT